MLLADDTTNDYSGVALYGEQGLLAERIWRSGRGHSEQLLPYLDALLADLGIAAEQLTAVAAALGPGSWSGLRVGLSLAKGLAVARDLPIVGISALECLAYPHQWAGQPVFPVIRLGRARYAVAEFRSAGGWQQLLEPTNMGVEELVERLPERAIVCGELDDELLEAARAARGEGLIVPSQAMNVRRTGYLAELAWGRHCAGQYDDLVTLEPIYLGHPVKTNVES